VGEAARALGSTTDQKRMEILGKRTNIRGGQEDSDFKGSSLFNKQKWLPVARDLPFMVSHYCCHVMKKRPMSHYSSQTKRKAILGVMADESRVRKQAWLRNGCNAFEGRNKHSQPMAFWTEQDVLEYIRITGLEIAPVYGEVVYVDKKGNQCDGNCEGCKLKCTGAQRTGCVYCGFGFHSESKKEPTRFQLLAETHPKLYEYAIGGGQWADNPAYDPTVGKEPDEYGWVHWNPKKIWVPSKSGLGMGKVFDMCNEIYGEDFMRYK